MAMKVSGELDREERGVEGGAAVRRGYLRKSEAARYLGIAERTLSAWMTRRLVPYVKVSHRVVMFRIADLDRAMERFRVKAVGED
jgi:hypothetical protein